MIKYAIFDMDGTLLDTERIFKESWIITSDRWGLDGAEDIYVNIVGRSRETIRVLFEEKYGTEYNFDKFFDERMRCFTELVKDSVPVKEGCMELLDFMKAQGIPCALATSTPMYITGRNLALTGIDKYMSAVVTSEMVKKGKPAPDIFIEAAKRLGARADYCMVVEDSYNGLRAAHKAGMLPVMVIDSQAPNEETEKLTLATCNSLLDVIDVVKRENNLGA